MADCVSVLRVKSQGRRVDCEVLDIVPHSQSKGPGAAAHLLAESASESHLGFISIPRENSTFQGR